MPKKHHNHSFAKPASTAHHTLASSGPRGSQNDRFRPSQAFTSGESSVNDLISHLRRTQVSRSATEDGAATSLRHVAPRSVHPSLRSLLELPELPPPRPRPGSRRVGVGGRPLRRLAGPPPPESWLLGNSAGENAENNEAADLGNSQTERIIYRLDRLPGRSMPEKHTLLHTVLKSMASQWVWHIQYDGAFLDTLPSHIKMLLLSYVGIYARDQSIAGMVQGLRPLFEKQRLDNSDDEDEIDRFRHDSEVVRLDLGCAIGRWVSMSQLSRELVVTRKSTSVQQKQKEPVPSSWDAESDEDGDELIGIDYGASLPRAPSQGLRFQNLRYLSLAHPTPSAANWNSLINLLSRLSTLTHLSLAHWPVPSVTPNAVAPMPRMWALSYNTATGTKLSLDDDWAEAAGVLRRLARATYCLKWLDLEGCGDWLGALTCDSVGPNGEARTPGPEWNGSWRNIEFVRLGPGWLPPIDESELFPASGPAGHSSRSLATSIHSPIRDGSEETDLPWDIELERIKYRRSREIERFRETLQTAKEVQQRVQRTRREGKGKWVQFSFGLEGLEESVLKKLIGADFLRFLP